MSDMKRLFYVWFLGAKECRGLRGDEFVRPIVRYFQRKEAECEPSKVTLQISSKGIKLVADSLRHFVPSHAVTYVCQGAPPDDDIVSVILLLYNPITKCPVHLHAYRCDSVETADLLAEQLQLLVDLPENQRKIRDLEQRLQSQGLYPSAAGHSQSRMLIKSCDTGLGGSSGDLLAGHSDSSSDDVANDVTKSSVDLQRPVPFQTDPAVSKTDQERIARLYDSLAAELRDKLGGAMSGKAAPLLLPPKDYEHHQEQESGSRPSAGSKNQAANAQSGNRAGRSLTRGHKQTDNASSSGPSSGIGSDLDDPVAERSRNREWMRSMSCQQPDNRHHPLQLQQPRQRYSYHDSGSSNILHQAPADVPRRRDPVMRQMSERRETSTLLNRRSMSDLRRHQEESSGVMLRRREESCRDIRACNAELGRSRADFQQQHPLLADGNRSRVKEALSKFESREQQQHQHEPVKAVGGNSRSRSFRDEQPSQGWNSGVKYRRQQTAVDSYQELDQRERFPGLDRETARVVDTSLLHGLMSHHHHHNHLHHNNSINNNNMNNSSNHQQRHLQRHKSSEFVSLIKRGPNESGSVVVVEPTQKVGNRHFRAVRQPN